MVLYSIQNESSSLFLSLGVCSKDVLKFWAFFSLTFLKMFQSYKKMTVSELRPQYSETVGRFGMLIKDHNDFAVSCVLSFSHWWNEQS